MQWAAVLAYQAPRPAIALCLKLREVFYEAHPSLLIAYLDALVRLWPDTSEDEKPVFSSEITGWSAVLGAYFAIELKADPTHHRILTGYIALLSPEDRLEIEARARNASPGPAVSAFLDRQGQTGP
jgi:hypothetical protein